MSDAENVVPFTDLRGWTQRTVRRIAAASGNVEWPIGTRKVMWESDIYDIDVLHTLRTARLGEEPMRKSDGTVEVNLRQRFQGRGMLLVKARVVSQRWLRVLDARWEEKS